MTRYLIIGNSSGGIGAAEAIREVDPEGALTIVSEEPYPAYSRPLISNYLAGETPLERMGYRPPSFYRSRRIDLVLGQALTRIDCGARQAQLAGGSSLPWDRLLLAVGGTPIVPPIEGVQKGNHFTFTTLDDAKRLAEHLPGKRRAVVVGGGLIGLSVTEALAKRGLEVTIVELAPQILGRALDAHAAGLVQQALEHAGVRVLTERTVARAAVAPGENGDVSAVVLDDGTEVPCDTLVIAIGVRPRTEVVAGTGITVNRGIVVDRHMATSRSGVYACGDVAEAYDFVVGSNRLTPIWPNAFFGGRIAGSNMAGREKEYAGGTGMNSLHSFGLSIMSAGTVVPPTDDEAYEVLAHWNPDAETYRKLVLHEGRIVGMIFAGDVDRAGVAFGLMRTGTCVESFKERLLDDGLGLLTLPAGLREGLLRA